MSVSADSNGDNHDGFIDIDELLSGRQRKGSASMNSDCGGIAQIVDNGIRDSNPIGSSRSTGPTAKSLEKSDITNGPLTRHCPRQDDTKNLCRKRPRTPALTGPLRTASLISTALESNDSEHTRPVARFTAPAQERESDTDQETADDGGSDDSDDQDYSVINNAAASKMRHPPHSRKRVKRGNMKPNDGEIPSTQSLNISCDAIVATSSFSMQESEEIPIRGFLTLKTIESKVVYCLTFSQELLLEPGRTSQGQDILRSVSSSSDGRKSGKSPAQEEVMSRLVKKSRFSSEEDDLLLRKKGEGLSWDEISEYFPERTKGTLQVHYSTKLKIRSNISVSREKRRRSS